MTDHSTLSAASPWVMRFAPLVEAGAIVLDVACGGGRHSRLFLERGHAVCAVDKDPSFAPPEAQRIQADLETGTPPPWDGRQFGAVICTNYLWRPLLPAIRAALGPGGLLIYETFAQGNEAFGRPRNPDFLLRPGELLELCKGLTIIAYEHGIIENRAVVQRICAVAGPGPAALPL